MTFINADTRAASSAGGESTKMSMAPSAFETGVRMPGTVAVFRIGQLGDTLAALPAISAIREGYPDSRMVLITHEPGSQGSVSSWDVLEATGFFSQVLFYGSSPVSLKNLSGYLKVAMRIRRLKADILFYLAPSPRFPGQVGRDRFFFQTVCGMKQCYGMESTEQTCGLRDGEGHLAALPSEIDRLLSVVGRAGLAIPEKGKEVLRVPIGEGARANVSARWQAAKFPPECLIVGLGPGSKMPAKRWPLDRFIETVKRLSRSLSGIHFIVLGGPEDREFGVKLVAMVGPQVVNWAGSLSVLESAEALRRCALYLGNDTGTMHLAAAVGTRCVAIFSSRDHPGKWYPYGQGHVVIRKRVPCEGCFLTVCEEQGMACLMEISVEEVCQAVLSVLNVAPLANVIS